MDSIFAYIGHWHWIAFGVVLISLEVFISGFVIFWFGIAAIIVGILVAIFPEMSWEWQIIIFSISSVASIFAWFNYAKNKTQLTDRPELNDKGAQYLDRIFTLKSPIVDGVGKIKVGDTSWRVAGEDTPEGKQVKVVGLKATTLLVEPVE